MSVHIQRGGRLGVPQNFGDCNNVRCLLQSFGGKGMSGCVDIDALEMKFSKNFWETIFENFGLKRVSLLRAENQVMGIEIRFPLRKFRIDLTNYKKSFLARIGR